MAKRHYVRTLRFLETTSARAFDAVEHPIIVLAVLAIVVEIVAQINMHVARHVVN